MPIVEARRRCPRARYIAPNHGRYSEVSDQVFTVLRSFTPLVEGLSVDEAFLDVSGLWRHYDSAITVGEAVRAKIRAEVGIPSSVGIAPNKFLAKLASEEAKPDGLWVVRRGEELAFLHPLPVRRLWGVGEATYAALDALRIETAGDVASAPLRLLEDRLGPSLARHLKALADGQDDRAVEPGGGAKSISVEATYQSDLLGAEAIERALLRHCDRLSARLRRAELAGRTITLKVRFGDFTTITRSHTVEVPIEHTPDLWDAVQDLLCRVDLTGREVRLLGVGAGGLVASSEPRQLSLSHPGRDAVAEAAEQVRARFGDDAVVPARLIDPPEPSKTHRREV
jgi:DNA polymerase-4